MTREFFKKLETGEYISEWNGYSPFYAGCFYGSDLVLGGEEKFSHCYDFFSGIGDVEWWIKEELDNLTEKQQEELLSILKRNKAFYEYKNKLVPELAKLLNVEPYQIYIVPNKDLYEFLNLIHSNANPQDILKGNYYD
jgi:hypothetical protein